MVDKAIYLSGTLHYIRDFPLPSPPSTLVMFFDINMSVFLLALMHNKSAHSWGWKGGILPFPPGARTSKSQRTSLLPAQFPTTRALGIPLAF